MTHRGDIDRSRAIVASLKLPPLTLEIFERTGWLPISACIAARALLHPETPALVELSADGKEQVRSWRDLAVAIETTTAQLVDAGGKPGDRIAVALSSGAGHVIVTQAAWRLGATVVPIGPFVSHEVRAELASTIGWRFLVDAWVDGTVAPSTVPGFRLADPHSILPTGGTLGAPRWAVQRGTVWGRLDGPPNRLRDNYGLADQQRQLVTLPMHHGFGFGYAHQFGLAYGHCLVVQQRFDAEQALTLIERWRIQLVPTVPTVLSRIARAVNFEDADLSSVEVILHSAAPCPPDVRQTWMDRVGGSKLA